VRSVLKLVRAVQPVSRADLARLLNINRSSVTEIVKPLLAQGTLREGTETQSGGRVGRPSVGLFLRSDNEFFIGVNIGVRQSQVGAATADGAALASENFETPSTPAAALSETSSAIRRMTLAAQGRTLLGIGVSVPGPVNVNRTRLLDAPHLGWHDVEIAETFRRTLAANSLPNAFVIVENDATAAATYEVQRRWKRAMADEDFVLVRAGTGIGVGIVMGNEVFRGNGQGNSLAGEFGHMTIVAGGKLCACGNRGCWERYASARSAAALYAGDRFQARGVQSPRFADAGLGDKSRALEQLEKAADDRVGWLIILAVEPRFDTLCSEPRYVELLQRLGLAT
jgi:predicted NBD/HSP70 family sugar kinase